MHLKIKMVSTKYQNDEKIHNFLKLLTQSVERHPKPLENSSPTIPGNELAVGK